jgi:hypothetical protein
MMMLSKIRTKWYMLAAGATLMGFTVGQCVGDWIKDAVVFSIIN